MVEIVDITGYGKRCNDHSDDLASSLREQTQLADDDFIIKGNWNAWIATAYFLSRLSDQFKRK